MPDTPKKKIRISNRLSHSAIRVFPARRNEKGELILGAQATAFFWTNDGIVYVITNWHNVTAWDPIKDRALSEIAFTPTCLDFSIELARDAGEGTVIRDRRKATLDLFDGEGRPLWLEHPNFGRKVDVVALKVGELGDARLLSQPINTYADWTDFDISVGDDAYVLGYPVGLDGGAGFPIWKRASIASEPDIDLDGLPKLVVDTATRKGMSGSPVIAVRRGMANPKGVVGITDKTVLGTAETFLGVYSGRLGDDPLGVQIGIVWKARVVEEILHGGLRGKTPFE